MDDYRGWRVYLGRWPERNWSAVHPDYDAAIEDDEWVGNGLATSANDLASLYLEVDAIMEEHPHFQRKS